MPQCQCQCQTARTWLPLFPIQQKPCKLRNALLYRLRLRRQRQRLLLLLRLRPIRLRLIRRRLRPIHRLQSYFTDTQSPLSFSISVPLPSTLTPNPSAWPQVPVSHHPSARRSLTQKPLIWGKRMGFALQKRRRRKRGRVGGKFGMLFSRPPSLTALLLIRCAFSHFRHHAKDVSLDSPATANPYPYPYACLPFSSAHLCLWCLVYPHVPIDAILCSMGTVGML